METEDAKLLLGGTFVKVVRIEGLPKERIDVVLSDRKGEMIKDICDFFGKGTLIMFWTPGLAEVVPKIHRELKKKAKKQEMQFR